MKASRKTTLAITVTLVSSVWLSSCARQAEGSPGGPQTDTVPVVPVANVTRGNLVNDVVLTAEFIPYQEVDVMAKVAGYVREIRVDIGDHVRQGEVLATLEIPEMQDDMAKSSAALQAAEANVATANENLQRAKAASEIAHLSYTRILEVSRKETGLVPRQDIDVAHSRDLEAQAEVSAAQSSLRSAEDRTREAQAENSRVETLYRYTSITAPFPGVITKRYANTGSMIQAGISSQTQAMPIVKLAQNDLLRLMLPVPVTAVGQIRVGQPVDVNLVSLGKVFPGHITRFAREIQMSTRTMDTEVDVPNPKLELVPGMYAEVRLHLEDRHGVLSAPLDAVEGLGSSPSVYAVDSDQRIRIRPVKTGLETPRQVEILSGVNEGDSLVVGRHTGLMEGEIVRPKLADPDSSGGHTGGN